MDLTQYSNSLFMSRYSYSLFFMSSQSSLVPDSIFANMSTHWNLFVIPKAILMGVFTPLCTYAEWQWLWMTHISNLGWTGNVLTISKCTFHSLFSATFVGFLCLFLVISLFKMSSKHCAEGLSSIKHNKAAIQLAQENILLVIQLLFSHEL